MKNTATIYVRSICLLLFMCTVVACSTPTLHSVKLVPNEVTNFFVIDAWVNDKQGRFLLDTGAARTLISYKFADENWIDRNEDTSIGTVAFGEIKFHTISISSFELNTVHGRKLIPLMEVNVHDLTFVNEGLKGVLVNQNWTPLVENFQTPLVTDHHWL
ncbi:retroviral-like aspartic protease family protein, partial [Motilimonas sp. E26]|nr:retroviral-like aspartic protease family protein [Motilimonas sp. E26]